MPGRKLGDRIWSPIKAALAGPLGAFVNSAAIHLSHALGLDAGTSGLSKCVVAHLNYWFRLSLPLHLRPAAQETFHTAVGIFAALLYAAFFHRRLPGPGWFRGLVFCQLLWAAQSLVVVPWLGKGYFGQGISASAPVWSWYLNAVFGIVPGAAAAGLLPLPSGAATGAEPGSIAPSNGSTDPFPILWLDKNGDRNQPAKPDQEPSRNIHRYGH